MGARVIATVSSDAKAAMASDAGADIVINYRSEDLEARITSETGLNGVQHVVEVDLAAHVDIYPKILAFNATVGAYASSSDMTPQIPFYPLAFRNICLQPVFVYSMSDRAKQQAIGDVDALLRRGELVPRIDRTFPLDDAVSGSRPSSWCKFPDGLRA